MVPESPASSAIKSLKTNQDAIRGVKDSMVKTATDAPGMLGSGPGNLV